MSTAKTAQIEMFADGALHVSIAPITWITIQRPERLNVLDGNLLAALATAMAKLEEIPEVRVVVITGAAARAFAAGADLSEISAIPDAAVAEALSRQGQTALARISSSPLPSIAAVNGLALGGGCELALSCDMRIAARGAQFGMPEVSLGLIPGFGGTQLLPALIGLGAALRLILSGETIDADQALRYGLVEQVVDDHHLHETVTQLATRIARHSAAALAAAKAAIRKSNAVPSTQGLHDETHSFGERVVSQESRLAVEAFFTSRRSKA